MPSGATTDPGAQASRRGEVRERAILDAALELVTEVWYERVTVDSIAARAQASKATMYRRWSGKAELVADALRRRALGETPAIPDTGSLRGDLLATVAAITRTFSGGVGPSVLGLLEAIRDDAVLRDVVGSQIRHRSREVGGVLGARAAARGEGVRPGPPGAALDVAFACLLSDTLFGGRPPGRSDQERLVDDVLLPLLDPRPSPRRGDSS